MNIEEKKQILSEMDKKLEKLLLERNNLAQEITEEQARFKIGDEITFPRGKLTIVGRIKEVLEDCLGKNSYIVIPKKKDGSDGCPVKLYWFDEDKAKLID